MAGLLLVALLLSDAATAPAAAASQGLAGGLAPVALGAVPADAAKPPQAMTDIPMPSGRAVPAPRPARQGLESDAWIATPSRRRTSMTATVEHQDPASPLERRLEQWPNWRLPAPLPRPGRRAPGWPSWFSGEWLVESIALPADPGEAMQPASPWRARFVPDGHGGVVADRAFNAFSIGRSQLGDQLLSVQDDPANPHRQLTRLARGELLETSLIAQRGESPQADSFLNDELSLQVLHGPGEPRLSRIETLGRWQRLPDGSITGEQWQARYAPPSAGLAAPAISSDHWRLKLVPVPPGSDRATEKAAPAEGYR